MSMPKFPDVDPELTCESSLNMILASIAMEELALSHIINAEGEKLQYVLGTLESSCGKNFSISEILAVNKSITCLLDIVSQNQMLLKSKMDKVLCAMTELCIPHPPRPEPPCPPCPPAPCEPPACSACFHAGRHVLWRPCTALGWELDRHCGDCICHSDCDKSRIHLNSCRPLLLSAAFNLCSKSGRETEAAISIQVISKHRREQLFCLRGELPAAGVVNLSTGTILIDRQYTQLPLFVELVSSDALILESASLSIAGL